VLHLLVDAHGEEAEDVVRETHPPLDLGHGLAIAAEEEVVVRRLGPLLDRESEPAAAHRLVLLDLGAVLDEQVAEGLDHLLGALLVLVGDDQEHLVVETV